MRRLGAVVLSLAVLVLAGCSDDDPDPVATPEQGPRPTDDSSAPETPVPGDGPCAMLGARRLSEIAGRELTVTAAQQQGRLVQCSSVAEPDEPLSVEWRVGEAGSSLGTLADVESLGLDPQRVELTGGVRAVVVQGEVAGIPVGKVITVAGGQQVVVEARLLGMDKDASDLAPDDLTRIATEVAESYVVGAGV